MSGDAPLFFDENQPALFSSAEIGPLFSEEERQGIYTAERLQNTDPKKFAFVCNMLADPGLSYRRITKATGCHHYTLKAVEQSRPELIEAAKQRLRLDLANVATKCIDLINENLDQVPVKTTTDLQKLSIVGAVAIDKHELLSGNATARVARMSEGLEDAKAHFDKLPGGSGPVLEADYVITSFSGDAPRPKEDEPAAQAGEAPEALEDSESA